MRIGESYNVLKGYVKERRKAKNLLIKKNPRHPDKKNLPRQSASIIKKKKKKNKKQLLSIVSKPKLKQNHGHK